MWSPAVSLLASTLFLGVGVAFPSPIVQPIDLAGNYSTLLRPRHDEDPWHYCGDQNWKAFNEGSFVKGLRLMGRKDDYPKYGIYESERDEMPDAYVGVSGKCVNLWCTGSGSSGVVLWLCQPATTPNSVYLPKNLAQMFHDGFHDCFSKKEPVTGSGTTRAAFHVWAPGYDLHVEGGYDGMKCPEDTQKDRFARPSSLDQLGQRPN